MRGVLFTACLTILALVVLTTSFLFHQQGMEEQGSIARLALFDRMADEVAAVENGFKEILKTAGLEISIEGNVVSISEPMPNPNFDNFNDYEINWKDFVENNSDFSLTLEGDFTADPSLIIQPGGIEYTHTGALGGDTIEVWNTSSIIAYVIDITIDINEDVSTGWSPLHIGTDINFTIYIHANNEIFISELIDSNQISTLVIHIPGKAPIQVKVGKPADIRIGGAGEVNATVVTSMTINTTETLSIALFEQSINITESQYNISRVSPVGIV